MPRTRQAADLDPRLIRLTNAVGWCWLAICLVGALVFSLALAPHLPSTVWVYSPAGRSTGPSAYPWRVEDAVIAVWILVLVFAATMAASQRWSARRRAWILVLVILFTVFFSAVIVGTVATSVPQLGLRGELTRTSALGLIAGPGGLTVGTGILALVTVLGIPALILNRSRATG